jgi:transcriptional regulator with XRE-family HTH domain
MVEDKLNKMREMFKAKRKAMNLSQEALANKIGMARVTVNRMEMRQKSPSIEQYFKLCEALGIIVTYKSAKGKKA